MDHVLSHVVRRGASWAQEGMKSTAAPGNDVATSDSSAAFQNGQSEREFLENLNIPKGYVVFLAIMAILVCLVSAVLNYFLMHVMATLTMVESPSADSYVPLETDPNFKGDTDPELLLVKQPIITSKIRLTLKYLRSQGGSWAPVRGASLALFNSFITVRLAEAINFIAIRWVVGSGLLGMAIASVASSVILARLSMAWTHIVISAPSPKRWYQRLGSCKDGKWKKVAGPTALLAIARQAALLLPAFAAYKSGLEKYIDSDARNNMTKSDLKSLIMTVLGIFVLGITLHVLIVIPAKVTLTRVQASLLSDEEETIVPFDRSFGGKVVPAIVGGSGVIGTLDAWKTFDWSSRVRLLKLYLKAFCITIFVDGFITIALLAPVFFFF